MAVGPPPPPNRIAGVNDGQSLRMIAAQLRREADSFVARAKLLEEIAGFHFPEGQADDGAL